MSLQGWFVVLHFSLATAFCPSGTSSGGIPGAIAILEKPDELRGATQLGSPFLQIAKCLQPLGVGGNQAREIQHQRPLGGLAHSEKLRDGALHEPAGYRDDRRLPFNPRLDSNVHE